jgi:hypothetical protein
MYARGRCFASGLALSCMAVVLAGSLSWAAPPVDAPFGIDKRPMPSGRNLEVLVPALVGTFKRDALPAGAKPSSDEDLNVTYRSGKDRIDFGFSIPETAADAHEAIKVTREEGIASKVPMKGASYSVGTEPSFFNAADFISWSRGNYFFYAKANSAEALASFMKAFPY